MYALQGEELARNKELIVSLSSYINFAIILGSGLATFGLLLIMYLVGQDSAVKVIFTFLAFSFFVLLTILAARLYLAHNELGAGDAATGWEFYRLV